MEVNIQIQILRGGGWGAVSVHPTNAIVIKLILPSSASTQFNSSSTSIEAEMVLFPFDPATHPPTHPPGKVSIETGEESNKKG